MSVVSELGKRNVIRVGAAYLVTAWLIVQVAETLFPLFGFGETPTRVIVIVLAIGFCPALILAWVFRMTPSGLRKESDLDVPLSLPAVRRLDRGIMIAMAVALCVFAVKQFVFDPGREESRRMLVDQQLEEARQQGRSEALIESYRDKSIAVLPFVNMSDDAGNQFFADGLSEEILNLLSKFPELRVISRSSAFYYRGKNLKLDQIASELNVAHILEGSVRKSGDRLRITAQLIDARSDTHLWSETFDRDLDDIFAIQQDIASAVAERLKLSLLDDVPHARQTDPDAYALYLQARYLSQQGTADGYSQSIELLEQVLSVDPAYTHAWDTLAGIYVNQAAKGLRDTAEGFELARTTAERVLEIDPNFAPAYARLGRVAMLHDDDLAAAARYYERALRLAPTNVRIISDATALLKSLGRIDECIKLDEYVVARDPVNAIGHFNLGGSYLFARRYDAAIASFQASLRLSPNRIAAHYFLGIARLLDGDPAAALESVQKEQLEVLRLLGTALANDALGNRDTADRLQAELISQHSQDAAYNIAYLLAYRGDSDAAFDWLYSARSDGDPGLADIVADPLFDKLRSDKRWLPFLTTIGRAPQQVEKFAFKVDLPQP